jgi:hypothetical protein
MSNPVCLFIIHELLCAALFYSVFCRAVRSCEKVRTDVRFSFFLLGVVACAGMAAPLVWQFRPSGFTSALLAAVTLVQVVTAKHWDKGVPDRFIKPGQCPVKRGECDGQN